MLQYNIMVIPNQKALAVAELLVTNFVYCFGVLWELHTDQGCYLKSCMTGEVLQCLGVNKACTTPVHLQLELDSTVECYIRTVEEHLLKSVRHTR